MKIVYFGDVVGRSGRDALIGRLPEIRHRLEPDFIAVNGENAAGGFGITREICETFYEAGVDVITTGNHVWAQRETQGYIANDARLLRPHNFPKGTPGRGVAGFMTKAGKTVIVLHVMGRLFMDPLDDPFATVQGELGKLVLGGNADFILLDVHAEATSEKMALAHYVDGRVSLVVGSHTHVPTADHQILVGGTGYVSDAGMCGDYDSVIGMEKTEPINRFVRKMPAGRLEPASGEGTVCGVYAESDDKTGLTVALGPIRQGGRLSPAWPV